MLIFLGSSAFLFLCLSRRFSENLKVCFSCLTSLCSVHRNKMSTFSGEMETFRSQLKDWVRKKFVAVREKGREKEKKKDCGQRRKKK